MFAKIQSILTARNSVGIVSNIPIPNIPLTNIDLTQVWYFVISLFLGSLSAMASLLGSTAPLSKRVIGAYILSGGIVSLGIVLLLVERYGFSYFLFGTSIFAGYKAFDVLSLISVGVTSLVKRFINSKSDNSNT